MGSDNSSSSSRQGGRRPGRSNSPKSPLAASPSVVPFLRCLDSLSWFCIGNLFCCWSFGLGGSSSCLLLLVQLPPCPGVHRLLEQPQPTPENSPLCQWALCL